MCPESQDVEKIIYWQLTRSSKNHRKFTENSPPGGEYWGILGNLWVFANATARSRDSAPRGQGGGSPPCTSCLRCAKKLSPGAEFIPPLGTLCSQITHSPHSVPRKPLFGKKFISLQPFVMKSPKIHRISPTPGPVGCVSRFE